LPGRIFERIGAVFDTIAVHIVMLMCRIAVVVVILPGTVISMTAVTVCSSRVCKCRKRQSAKEQDRQYTYEDFSNMLHLNPLLLNIQFCC